jgi:hypothetical protein|tara:strand:- start:174 stop:572 length:399 start_codon:yes stop_codon:yes gene_type:complete
MIEDEFYATLKLNSGEEIYAKVAASEEEGRTMLILHSPITIVEVKQKGSMVGYKVEPWLKTTKDDMFIINMDKVITLSESTDLEIISVYQQFVQDMARSKSGVPKLSRRMGYVSSVNDAKDILEKIYKKKSS